jgi:hypothetical protein
MPANQFKRWQKGYISCLLASWQDAGQVPFSACFPVEKTRRRTGPAARSQYVRPSSQQTDGQVLFMSAHLKWHDGGQLPFSCLLICLPVDMITDRSSFPVCLPVEGPIFYLPTSWQDGGKVPFPIFLPVGKMAESFLFLSAYKLTRWRKGSFSCLLTSWKDGVGPISCLLTSWQDGKQVLFSCRLTSLQDDIWSEFPVCLPELAWWETGFQC